MSFSKKDPRNYIGNVSIRSGQVAKPAFFDFVSDGAIQYKIAQQYPKIFGTKCKDPNDDPNKKDDFNLKPETKAKLMTAAFIALRQYFANPERILDDSQVFSQQAAYLVDYFTAPKEQKDMAIWKYKVSLLDPTFLARRSKSGATPLKGTFSADVITCIQGCDGIEPGTQCGASNQSEACMRVLNRMVDLDSLRNANEQTKFWAEMIESNDWKNQVKWRDWLVNLNILDKSFLTSLWVPENDDDIDVKTVFASKVMTDLVGNFNSNLTKCAIDKNTAACKQFAAEFKLQPLMISTLKKIYIVVLSVSIYLLILKFIECWSLL